MARRTLSEILNDVSVDAFRQFAVSLGYTLKEKRRDGKAEVYVYSEDDNLYCITLPGCDGLTDKAWVFQQALDGISTIFGWTFEEALIKLLNFQYPGKYDWVADGRKPTVRDSITDDELRPEYMQFLCTIQIGEFPRQVRMLYFDEKDGWKKQGVLYNDEVIAWRRLPEMYCGEKISF